MEKRIFDMSIVIDIELTNDFDRMAKSQGFYELTKGWNNHDVRERFTNPFA